MTVNLAEYNRLKEELQIAVSARKEAERLAQHSESRYKAFIRHAADAIFVFDFDGCFLEVNYQATANLGYTREELLQLTVADIVPGVDVPTRRPLWNKLEFDKPYTLIATHRRKDGSIFPVETRLTALQFDGKKVMMALVSDITERKNYETSLQESVAFRELLLQTMPVPVFYKDMQGRYSGCNSAFADFVGKSKEEIIGKTVFNISPQQFAPTYRDKDTELMESAEGVQIYDGRVIHADGSHHDVVFHKARIVNASGDPVGIIGVILDISERKKYEDKQLSWIHQLEEKELAKTRFLASAGHDLRQPIAAASLFVQALKLTSQSPSQSAMIQKLDESMNTFSDLLEQLLNISKFDSGLIKSEPGLFSLADIFNWLEHNLAQAALDKDLLLRFHFPENKFVILNTDIGLMKSVLMNLLSNAIKFTAHGSVMVSARIRGGKVLLQVWDTGMGINADNLAHIFDEFYQVGNPQRDRKGGLGLGLSIVKRSLALMGSEISCRSTIGKGSVFSFLLPLESSIDELRQQPATENFLDDMFDDSYIRGQRFVIVEDDALVSQALLCWLEEMGGKVQLFTSAEKALGSGQIGDADYYIADYMLGGTLNGIQFLNQLRQNLGRPINAVVVTGDTSPAFVHAAASSDWPVLYKPVKTSELIARLRALTELKN